MNTLDFVCSLILGSELVCAVFIFPIILESSLLTIFPSCLCHSEALARVLEDSDSECSLRYLLETSENTSAFSTGQFKLQWCPVVKRHLAVISDSIYILVKKQVHRKEIYISLKFISLEEKAFFVKYLNLYKKMLEKGMGNVYKTCFIAWGRGSPRLNTLKE